jgi:hypothetical protein
MIKVNKKSFVNLTDFSNLNRFQKFKIVAKIFKLNSTDFHQKGEDQERSVSTNGF